MLDIPDFIDKELEEIKVKSQCQLFMMQFGAMFKKRFHYFKRDKKGLCCEILCPFIMMLIPVLVKYVFAETVYYPAITMDQSMYPVP